MHRSLLTTILFAGAILIAPVAINAADHRDKKYYDRDAHDYHTWNNNEDRAYRAYLTEHHQDYREFKKVKPAHQKEYFKWRHDHPDTVLFKAEIH